MGEEPKTKKKKKMKKNQREAASEPLPHVDFF
jgi:hypothetical protein